VDEAILLADRIFLMTNGPQARIAEAVEIDLPRPRQRAEIVKHPHFYTIRNYLVDFLVNRSSELRTQEFDGQGLRYPTPVNPVQLASADTTTDSPPASPATEPQENLVKFTPKEVRHG
jgi:nitrate/nitrite transport system ATP-binding protein